MISLGQGIEKEDHLLAEEDAAGGGLSFWSFEDDVAGGPSEEHSELDIYKISFSLIYLVG